MEVGQPTVRSTHEEKPELQFDRSYAQAAKEKPQVQFKRIHSLNCEMEKKNPESIIHTHSYK